MGRPTLLKHNIEKNAQIASEQLGDTGQRCLYLSAVSSAWEILKYVVNGCTGCTCVTKANIENKVEGYIKCDITLKKSINFLIDNLSIFNKRIRSKSRKALKDTFRVVVSSGATGETGRKE